MRTLHQALGATIGAAALLTALGAGPAVAQSIDHGSLQDLFGEPVTTSATGKPQRVTDAPATMEIITAEDIRRSAATDIPGVLRGLAGVNVTRHTLGQADVSVRGYNQPYSPRLLVLINGRQVYLDHFAMTAWQTLPVQMEEIRQIEVVKGPNAALFGFNAVGGVINIVTYNPLYDDVDNGSVTVGTQSHREVSAINTAQIADHTGIRVSAGSASAEEFDTPVQDFFAPYREDLERRTVRAESLSQVGAKSQLGFTGSFSRVDETDYLPFPGYAKGKFKTYSGKMSYSVDSTIGLIDASLYHNGYEGSVDCVLAGHVPLDNQVTVAKLQDLFKLAPEHSMRIAAEYRHNQLTSTPTVTSAEVGYDVYSGSGMWDWQVTDSVSWTNALRLDALDLYRDGPMHANSQFTNDDYDRTLYGYSYNSGVVWKASGKDTIRASVGRGLQTPSLIELGFHMNTDATEIQRRTGFNFGPNASVFTSGNPYLQPTVVRNGELGYDRALEEFDSKARITAFYQQNEDLKTLPRMFSAFTGPQIAAGATRQFDNAGDSTMWGIEAGLESADAGAWRWGANYTYLQITDHLSVNTVESGLTHVAFFEQNTPMHQINGNLGYTTGPWSFDGYVNVVGSHDALNLNSAAFATRDVESIATAVTFSGRAGYEIKDGMEVSLTGIGIEESRHEVSSAPDSERRVLLRFSASY